MLAWLNDPKFFSNVTNAVQYLASQCKGGSFSSTQATVLALKAIVAYLSNRFTNSLLFSYDAASASPTKEGSVVARLNGQDLEFISFDTKATGTLEMPSFADRINPGKYELEIEMLGGSRMPFTYSIEFNTLTGVSSARCVLDFGIQFSSTTVTEGEGLEMDVNLSNKTNQGQPMTGKITVFIVTSVVAILGIPGGLDFRHTKLQELVKSKTVDYYETSGRSVTLYWRSLPPDDKKSFKVDLVAMVPGKGAYIIVNCQARTLPLLPEPICTIPMKIRCGYVAQR